MAAKIQNGGHKSIKTSQKHIFAFTCLNFGSSVDQTLINVMDILDIKNIQYFYECAFM